MCAAEDHRRRPAGRVLDVSQKRVDSLGHPVGGCDLGLRVHVVSHRHSFRGYRPVAVRASLRSSCSISLFSAWKLSGSRCDGASLRTRDARSESCAPRLASAATSRRPLSEGQRLFCPGTGIGVCRSPEGGTPYSLPLGREGVARGRCGGDAAEARGRCGGVADPILGDAGEMRGRCGITRPPE
uniref:Uncharacterized protein n=1 Tax=Cereibacter sphaeroides (strain ATCC 17025 / ATH 2.4.3) TaxID=349102 RepID=A4WNS5_CERS5